MLRIKTLLAVVGGSLLSAFAAVSAHAADALVTADWLQNNLDNPKVRVFEVSVDSGIYERGHIPGATNLNWHTDLVDR
ncbi:MAG: sulfurtransferase, partial [Rhizobium pusense]|nr:sulfurtransferase [Agrobacterium pusense]